MLRRFFDKVGWRGLLTGMLCGLAAWLLALVPLLRGLEEWMLDGCFFARGERDSQARARVVLIGLDENSLAELHKPLIYISPEIAKVVAFVHQQKAAAIGIDLIIQDNLRDLKALQENGEGDPAELGTAILEADNVVVAEMRLEQHWLRSLSQWRSLAFMEPASLTTQGFVNLTADKDHFLRRQQLVVRDGDDKLAHVHFALALHARASKVQPEWKDGQLWVGGQSIPLDAEDKLRINFVGPPRTFEPIPFREVLAAAKHEPARPMNFAGAIVIIGVTASSQMDLHTTPFANGYWRGSNARNGGLMVGPEIHAHLLATLGDAAYLTPLPWLSSWPLLLVFGALLGMAFEQLNRLRRTLTFFLAGLALLLVHHFAWKFTYLEAFRAGWQIQVLPMLFLGLFAYCGNFMVRWFALRRILRAFKSSAISEALEADPGQLYRKGEERVITVLFADIRGFTRYSEGHAAREVVDLLNTYFTAVVPVLEAHGGTLNQYMGDGMMVLFGAPESCAEHALQAVRAAVALVGRVRALASTWAAHDFADFRIGIGIHTGSVIVGTVGSPRRLDYSAIGDTTNIAARIEAENKQRGTQILISADTYLQIPKGERERLGCSADAHAAKVTGKGEVLHLHIVEFQPVGLTATTELAASAPEQAALRTLPELRHALAELAEDLLALERALEVDVPSALNKIRYITEKIFHTICQQEKVAWGQAEPTLERMLGPLVANHLLPRNVAIHARTIQNNTSPGSHYQQDALSASHVAIAQQALIELLGWYASASRNGAENRLSNPEIA